MIIKSLTVGSLQVNCYIVYDEATKDAIVIDPGDEPDMVMDLIEEVNLKVNFILLTHGHFDHIGAVDDMKGFTGAPILLHKADKHLYSQANVHASMWGFRIGNLPEPERFIEEGDEIKAGALEFRVLHTPGHTHGSSCFYGMGVLFSGDTLFRDSIGRTDLPGGDMLAMGDSFRKLMELPLDTVVYCGHGPATTIGREKKENFFSSTFL
ncbi:MAG TPA: MBL fold metallo-hydrolase [Thermodesulfovibrionia bacterium]|nr:MBL fold metallo-hydrolase [Thermodesulfovibrionia bacterium]